LKISGADEPRSHLELQNDALMWLGDQDPDVPVPQLVRTMSGERMTRVDGMEGQAHQVRLLTYLPGVPLAQFRPHSPDLLRDIGHQLGTLDRALQGFAPSAARRDFVWNLANAPSVIHQHVDAIERSDRREIVASILEQWQESVEPVVGDLRRSVVYNDANDHNVLVEMSAHGPAHVSGFVDFGDLVECFTVADPAIAAAYVLLGKSNPLAATVDVVRGFHEVFPLAEPELEVLFPLILARLAVSASLAATRRTDEPDNDYLTVSEEPAWRALEQLTQVHPRLAYKMLRSACGLAPCPNSPHVVAWLESHTGSFAPVIDPDPLSVARCVIDLSIASSDFPGGQDLAGSKLLSDQVFQLMADRGVKLGVGRYDEARFVYTANTFAGPDNELPERRTVHLGVDLFIKPGTPVFAPLDGRVVSVQNNRDRLDYGPTVILEHDPPEGPTFFTLYGHLAKSCLDALEPGMAISRGQAFAEIGPFRVNGNWPPHLHFQIITDMLNHDGGFPGVGAPSERDVWLSVSPDPNPILGLPDSVHAEDAMDREQLLAHRREHLGFNLSLSYREPLHIVRGRGQYLYDDVGHAYLDCVNNVCHVGHAHPAIVRAAADQMGVLNTNTRYLHEHVLQYAKRLCATLPEPLTVCYFVNSGSEANDLALRMARAHTSAKDVVVLEGGYHGHTTALIDVSPYKFDGSGGRGAPPYVHKVVMPDDYRGPYRRNDPECGAKYAEHVREAIARTHKGRHRVAAFLSETLLSCGGQIELPPEYLEHAYRFAREAGAVCIADEVQVGFGRVGSHFWGFETQGVVPDIVTMGKPIGNGHPIGAVITTREIAESFDTGMEYFNTYGGNPVSCAVGLAVLDVIEAERLSARAREVGTRLKAGLTQLMNTHTVVGDVRGRGLFLGVELVRDRTERTPAIEEADYVIERAKDHGVLLSTDGPDRNVLKVKPPLVFSEEDADRLVSVLDKVLAEDRVRRPGT
jgi:4-aminobutyrate aminotransferase-like enzyme/Ser/Thr protein kinase RdoA (MazF antagonist)